MRIGLDPITEDPAELDARADEDEREKRWDAFVGIVKARKVDVWHWSDVWDEASDGLFKAEESDGCVWSRTSFQQACDDFADLEGWDGVLSAIARAMRTTE